VVLAVVSEDARFLLLKNSIVTGAAAFDDFINPLESIARRRPGRGKCTTSSAQFCFCGRRIRDDGRCSNGHA
jgi:hypothetical protein